MINPKIIRRLAIKEARDLMKSNFCVMGTETTGLGADAEIVEISIIAHDGTELFTSLVRPTRPIPADVVAIHGITDDMVRNAPTWNDIHDCVMHLFQSKKIAIYNSEYDIRMLQQSSKLAGCRLPAHLERQARCVMNIFSKFKGEWSDRHGNWKWHKLSAAAHACGVSARGAHRAAADCRMTLGVLRHVAEQEI